MKTLLGITLIVLAVAVFLVGPFAIIWAVNTLFGTTVPFNFATWAAAAILYWTAYGLRRSK